MSESQDDLERDPYQGVSLVLLGGAILGMVTAFAGGVVLGNPVMLAAAVSMGLAAGILVGVLKAESARANPAQNGQATTEAESGSTTDTPALSSPSLGKFMSAWKRIAAQAGLWLRNPNINIRRAVAFGGASAVCFMLFQLTPSGYPTARAAEAAIVFSLVATVAKYLAEIEPARFPEAPGLACGARVITWILVLTAVSVALIWANSDAICSALGLIVLAINGAVCYSLWVAPIQSASANAFPPDIAVLSVLGRRWNIPANILDAAEQQLGIDLRSTWALTILRRSLEPLAIVLCLAGWLSTSLTVVGIGEQGLIERLGVPVAGQPLPPGLHLHWPWPVDRVFRIPVQKVQTIQIGHEGEEAEGPENVLWAVEHAPNEFTLVLGNGRDLITIDATLEYRIVDARAWRYHCQNPEAALRALTYRAVMRSTVNLTLSQAISQDFAVFTRQIQATAQAEADKLGLGIEVLRFEVGGLHPPVPVASAYEAVVSAELGKVTAMVNAQVYRNQTVPAAESEVVSGENAARANAAQALALASGQAWSFRTLESQYRAAPQEFFFRRRLETMEKVLPNRQYTILDSRFLRDGGEIWVTR